MTHINTYTHCTHLASLRAPHQGGSHIVEESGELLLDGHLSPLPLGLTGLKSLPTPEAVGSDSTVGCLATAYPDE